MRLFSSLRMEKKSAKRSPKFRFVSILRINLYSTKEKDEEASLHVVQVDRVIVNLCHFANVPTSVPFRQIFREPFLDQAHLVHPLYPENDKKKHNKKMLKIE